MNKIWTQGARFVTWASTSLVARTMALLLGMVLLKLALFPELRSELLQTHRHMEAHPPTWFDALNFHLSIALIVATLIVLGRRAQTWSNREVRFLNVGFAVSGMLFAFFSFEQLDANYLTPVAKGVLSWGDIWQYLKVNLFFGPPHLALYLIGYGVFYAVVIRCRREAWSFACVAGLAAVYWELNLRELVALGNALLAVNILGLAAFVVWWAIGRPLPLWAQLFPFVAAVPVWLFFAGFALPDACFTVVFSVALALYTVAWAAVRQARCVREMSCFLPFFFSAFLLLSVRNMPLAKTYNYLLIYSVAFPHYFAQALLICAGLLIIFACWRRVAPRTALAAFDVIALILLALRVADWECVRNLGIRLDWSVLSMGNDAARIGHTIAPFLAEALAALMVAAGIYALGVLRLRRWLAVEKPGHSYRRGSALAFPTLVFGMAIVMAPRLVYGDKATGSTVVRLVETSPLLRGAGTEKLKPAEFRRVAAELGFPFVRRSAPRRGSFPSGTNLNVVVILMESSYNRYLSLFGAVDQTQPRLGKYRSRMELFPNFFSNFPNSMHARFQVFNGLLAPREYITESNPRIEAPSLFEILHDHGYHTSLFYSSSRDYTRMADWVAWRKLDEFYDCDSMPGRERFQRVAWGIEEKATLEAMKHQLAEHAHKHERFFLSYIPAAPHMPYDVPSKEFNVFPVGLPDYDHNYSGCYKNELLYMDWIISSLIEEMEKLGLLDKTLVVITDDHGEKVGEGDSTLGHGWDLSPELCNTPLIIMDPRQRGVRVNPVFGSQIDVLPTLLDRLGIPIPSGELYEGASLYSHAASVDRPIYLISYQDRALVESGRYILERNGDGHAPGSGRVQVFEIANKGVKTVFKRTMETPDITSRLNTYERFQESLIARYAYYRNHANQVDLATRR